MELEEKPFTWPRCSGRSGGGETAQETKYHLSVDNTPPQDLFLQRSDPAHPDPDYLSNAVDSPRKARSNSSGACWRAATPACCASG